MRRMMLIGVMAGGLLAGEGAAQPAAAQEWPVQDRTLANGLTVLFLEDRQTPLVTVQVWYRVGSRNEQPGLTGLSHVTEHMMFKGTATRGPNVFSTLVQKAGGRHNAFTTSDYTVYFETLAPQGLDLALELEADRMANLAIDAKEFGLERNVVLEERRLRTDDNPSELLNEEVTATAFKAHPYQWPVIGWTPDLQAMTAEDVRRYYQTYYAPNNAFLVIAGHPGEGSVFDRVERYFGHLPRRDGPPAVRGREPAPQGERRVVLRRAAELAHLVIGYQVPNHQSEDAFPLDVLSAVLGEGRSSRLYRRLVYSEQKALTVRSDYTPFTVDPHLLSVTAQVTAGITPEELERLIAEEIERVRRENVSPAELARAKRRLEARFILRQDSLFYRALAVGQAEMLGGWALVREYLPRLRAVTAEQVRQAAERYLTEERRTVGVLYPTPGRGRGGRPAGRPTGGEVR